MNSNRYLRQTLLPEIGDDGQKRLGASGVLCVGSGGLGSPALLYLAAAGVGKIGVIDPDTVSVSNLQRQILFKTTDEGKEKVQAAEETLLALNPEINIIKYPEAFTERNALAILMEYDLVIDGSDNFSTKYLINDSAYIASIPVVYGSVTRFAGEVALFHGRKSSCYRCLHPSAPEFGIQNCAESGVLGPVVGTIGTLQATLAIQYLLSREDSNHPLHPEFGKITLFDFCGKWSTESIQVPKNPHCSTCTKTPNEIKLKHSHEVCTTDIRSIETITAERLQEFYDEKREHLLIDVREKEEWEEGHLPGAHHWPLSLIEKDSIPSEHALGPKLETTAPIILYCAGGVRSEKAARILFKNRSLKCLSLQGGRHSWNVFIDKT